MASLYDVVKRPVVSEKSTLQNETTGVYAFEVLKSANKTEIKKAVEALFGVNVTSVRTQVVHGKTRRLGRNVVKNQSWKKALVTLKEGQKIEIVQGV